MDISSSSNSSSENRKDLALGSAASRAPNWLWELESMRDQPNPTESYPLRPSTEDSPNQRPTWFQELMQPRRHSEVIISATKKSPLSERQIIPALQSFNIAGESKEAKSPDPDIIMVLDADFVKVKSAPKIRPKMSNFLLSSPKDHSDADLSLSLDPKDYRRPKSKDSEKSASPGENVFRKKTARLGRKKSFNAKDLDLIEILDDQVDVYDGEDFIIPELPEGRELVVEVHSNWGDIDYVGMNGIELFELKSRKKPAVEKIVCETDPKSNANKLIDGCYRTHDEDHIWMTNYQPFSPTKVRIIFKEKVEIVLCRIWNYNKSRIHTRRGVRYAVIKIDGRTIFKGEIAKASGDLDGPPERFGDTILFTTDEEILESVAENDTLFQELLPPY